jgi:hypothetical protein
VKESWEKTLRETVAFGSTPPEIKNQVVKYLASTHNKSKKGTMEEEKVYLLLAALDRQNKLQKPFQDVGEIIAYMTCITRLLSLVIGESVLAIPSETWSTSLVSLSHILHLHSLMTLAQMRRATQVFWNLAFAISTQK